MNRGPTTLTWPPQFRFNLWVRRLLRLSSPFAIGWYLLTRRRLSLQVGNLRFHIMPLIRFESRGEHNRLIFGHRREDSSPGTMFRPKVSSLTETVAFPGIAYTIHTLIVDFGKALSFRSYTITQGGLTPERRVAIIVFPRWPRHGQESHWTNYVPVT